MKALWGCLCALVTLAASPASADVEARIIKLFGGNGPQTFTVPAGQVFIIDAVVWDSTSGSPGIPTNFNILAPGRTNLSGLDFRDSRLTNVVVSPQAQDRLLVPMETPIRIPAGFTLALPTGENSTVVFPTTSFTFFGRLADEGDLFAQIDNQLINPERANGQLTAQLTPATNRPSRVVVEKSTDLETFEPVAAEVSAVEGSDSLVSLAVNDMNEDRLFIRARTQVRPSNP